MPQTSRPPERVESGAGMRRSYVRVILSWIAALAGLIALQEYFSVR